MSSASPADPALPFSAWLDAWGLVPDGAPIVTRSSDLLPVRRDGTAAMLKIAREAEESWGGLLMLWWDGDGAARVLAHAGDALLLERLDGARSLATMARAGEEDAASRILCAVADRLHAPRREPPPDLIPLPVWFRALAPAAATHGGILTASAAAARELLADPQDLSVLHGDLHHDNVLDGGPRGWLAIDPKRLIGERGFDYANIFSNPDQVIATAPGRLARQAAVVAEAARLDRTRLLRWILAWAGLSAVWHQSEATKPTLDLTLAEIAAAELGAG